MAQSPDQLDFAQLAFLREFRDDQREQLATLATTIHWRADEVIFREGSHAPFLYIVRDGRVALELTTRTRKRMTILTVGPGEMFGWTSLCADRPKFASARAVTATQAYAFRSDELQALCDSDPRFGYTFTRRVLATISERLRGTRMQLLDLFASPEHQERS